MAVAVLAAIMLTGCGAAGSGNDTPRRPASKGPPAPPDNGVAAKPVKEILADADAALRSARSVRVKATTVEKGERTRMDVKLTKDRDMTGWIEPDGLRVQLIVVDGRMYVRSRRLWEQQGGAGAGSLFGDRWVLVPKEGAKGLAGPTKGLSLSALTKEIFGAGNAPVFTGKSPATVGRLPAVRLRSAEGSYYIAATGKPYPLRLDAVGENGDFDFSEYDRSFHIKAPAGALDLSQLPG